MCSVRIVRLCGLSITVASPCQAMETSGYDARLSGQILATLSEQHNKNAGSIGCRPLLRLVGTIDSASWSESG
jgi:hypothetical protein